MNTRLVAALPADAEITDLPLADSIDTQARASLRKGLWIVGAWLGLMLLWALAAPISGGVVANGIVKVEANRRTVTHRDGGTVARVRVHEGQLVEKGQVLLELEDVRVEASADMLRAQLAGEKLRQSRLEAEAAGTGRWEAPAELRKTFADVKLWPEMAGRESATFKARQTHLAAQIEGDERQAADTRREIDIRLHERENSGRAITLMKEELSLNERLAAEQFVNRAKLITLERSVSEYESRLLTNEADLSQAKQRLGALEAHMQSLRDAQRQSASEDLRDVTARASDIEQRLRSSSDDLSRQTIVAPEAGRLLNLRINTAGSALGPREPIVDIVPKDARLVIEARMPLDVGAEVRPGAEAEIRLQTAHARLEKLIPAHVIQVAADAQEDSRNGAPFITMQLQVDLPPGATNTTALQPGLAAEVFIKVTERTPIGFILEPIAGYFRRAFREH
jgi:HlyD family type I secretion membrane fusion protein